jgi:hypothetical protein
VCGESVNVAMLLSGEVSAPCPPGDFSCRDGSCIPWGHYCNGRKECLDGEDELNCDGADLGSPGNKLFECQHD